MSSAEVSVKKLQTVTPTFLEDIFGLTGPIFLICDVKETSVDEITPVTSSDNKSPIEEKDEADLTGNPLEVDLAADGDLPMNISVKETVHPNWLPFEAEFYPLPINMAFNQLNQVPNKSSRQDLKVFIVCDASDFFKTIIMGNDPTTFTRYIVRLCGVFDSLTLPSVHDMKATHLKEFNKVSLVQNTNVTCYVRATYLLKGSQILRSAYVPTIDSTASIKCSWTELREDPEGSILNQAVLMLQIVTGHQCLPLQPLWEVLLNLHTLVDNFCSEDKLGDILISSDALDITDLENEISELIMKNTLNINPNVTPDFSNIDFQNLRDEDIMDKLYKVLLHCKDVTTLKECLIILFETVAQFSINVQLSSNNKTQIAEIVRQLLAGKIAVPNITLSEAFIYFVEMGIEKLKNDIFYIMNIFNFLNLSPLITKWGTFFNETASIPQTRGKSTAPKLDSNSASNQNVMAMRRTRMTVASACSGERLQTVTRQLEFLNNLYVFLELCFLQHSLGFSERNEEMLVKMLYEKYAPLKQESVINLDNSMEYGEIHTCKINTSFLEKSVLQTGSLLSWNLRLKSSTKLHKYTTIFHKSVMPIFPPSMYKPDDSELNNKETYYLAKGIIVTDELN